MRKTCEGLGTDQLCSVECAKGFSDSWGTFAERTRGQTAKNLLRCDALTETVVLEATTAPLLSGN